MSNQYYYLVSSLPELILDDGRKPISIEDFITICSEELKGNDLDDLKKIFLFNDIINTANYKNEKYQFKTPSYYSEEEFNENIKDADSFFVFLAEYFYNKKNDKRIFQNLVEVDEIVQLMYQNLDEFCDSFVKDYFLFELEIQNVTTALSMRVNDLKYQDKIIEYDFVSELIKKSNSPDFGVAKYVDYIEKLIELYKTNDLVKIEKTIEEIRWNWLDERVGINFSSQDFIYSYAVKLNSVARWVELTDNRGEETFNNLIENISMNIDFPVL